jgi:HlyD family secretion protein
VAGEDLSNLRIVREARTSGVARRRRGRVGRWLLLCAVVAIAAYFAATYQASVTVEAAAVSQAYPSQGYTLLNATGYVVAQRKAAVGSKATGRLEWLGVREGSRVKQGEVLARIESRDVAAQAEQAAANVKVARANLEQGEAELKDAERSMKRSQELVEQKFVSQAAHDQAVARYEKAKAAIASLTASIAVAQANYRAAQVGVEQTLIRAPFDGIVLTKNANVGDNITPFSAAADTKGAVVTMADMSTLEVEADVSESNLAKVKIGQPCEIQLDALPGIRFRGVVGSMVPTVDRAKATVTAKIRFVDHDARILPEMSAKVAFLDREVSPDERTPRTAVPAAALVERNGKTIAYRIENETAHATPVERGEAIGDLAEVKGGLKPGDRVVLKPPSNLRDGARVSLTKK